MVQCAYGRSDLRGDGIDLEVGLVIDHHQMQIGVWKTMQIAVAGLAARLGLDDLQKRHQSDRSAFVGGDAVAVLAGEPVRRFRKVDHFVYVQDVGSFCRHIRAILCTVQECI
jgi:hypothetical protein